MDPAGGVLCRRAGFLRDQGDSRFCLMTEPSRIRDSKLRDALMRVYWRLERLLAPRLEYSQRQYETGFPLTVAQGFRWLGLGCGHELLPSLTRAGEIEPL